jgi:hypothetical protein
MKMLTINSKIRPNESLFLSVDTSFFRNNEVIFTYLPRHETEARDFVANLVPYFYHKLKSNKIHEIFQPEALERAQETVWDEENEEIMTPSDLYLEKSNEINDDFDLLEIIGIENTVQKSSALDIDRVERLFVGEENTSVGSLFTQQMAVADNDGTANNTINTPALNSQSNKSVCTTITVEEMDKRMNIMSSELSQIKDMLQELTGKPRKNNNIQNSQLQAGEPMDSTCQQP